MRRRLRGDRADLRLLGQNRRRNGVAAARLRDVDARHVRLSQAQQLQLTEPLVQSRGKRATGGRRDDVLRSLPLELLDDLKRLRLRTLGVEGPQRDVRELHARALRHFATAAVGFVVVALHLAHLRAHRRARSRLRVLEAVRVEHVRVHARLRRV